MGGNPGRCIVVTGGLVQEAEAEGGYHWHRPSQQVAEAANKKFKFDMKGQGILQEHGQVLGRLVDVVKTWLKETDGTDAKPIPLMGDVSLMLPKGPDKWMLYEGRSVRPPFHHKMLYVPSIADILRRCPSTSSLMTR